MKKTYPSIPGLEPDAWSNDACRGYVIMAMHDCGFSHEDIRRVVRQLHEAFDFHTINEAEQTMPPASRRKSRNFRKTWKPSRKNWTT